MNDSNVAEIYEKVTLANLTNSNFETAPTSFVLQDNDESENRCRRKRLQHRPWPKQ